MIRIKKLLFNVLCNDLSGLLISRIFRNGIPSLRWRKFSYLLDTNHISKRIIASVFFGFYESSEIRFSEKYLNPQYSVVELGSSIGIVSSHIITKVKAASRFIMVEANPTLINTIKDNVTRHNHNNVEFEIVNKAISYTEQRVSLNITSNNTETTISSVIGNESSVWVNTTKLVSLIEDFNLGEYALVCDIEGSEIEIFIEDSRGLEQCRQIFIELHETHYGGKNYSISDLIILIEQKHDFKLVMSDGPVCFFEKIGK